MEKGRKNNVLLLAVILLLVSFLLLALSFLFDREPHQIKEMQVFVNLTIGQESGLGIFPNETDVLRFKLVQGSSASRKLIVKNNYEFKIRADFRVVGNVSYFLIFEPVVFLEPFEQKEATISTIIIPEDAVYGVYEGVIIVGFRKAA